MKSNNDLTILIVGALRDTPSFESSLRAASVIAKEAHQGALSVVVSTWESDHDKADQVISKHELKYCDVSVVTSKDISCDFRGNWMRQSILLHRGLSSIGSDSLVLKMRTDKTEWASVFARKTLSGQTLRDSHSSIFSKRITIPAASALEPYFFNDMVYSGAASDLLRLVPRLMQPIVEQWIINPEQIFHSAPVLEKNSVLADFFRQNRGLAHGLDFDQLVIRNSNILASQLHLQMAIESLEHLLQSYSFPTDSDPDDIAYDDLYSYIGNPAMELAEVISSPVPAKLGNHLRFNESAKSISVTSSHAVRAMLEHFRAFACKV